MLWLGKCFGGWLFVVGFLDREAQVLRTVFEACGAKRTSPERQVGPTELPACCQAWAPCRSPTSRPLLLNGLSQTPDLWRGRGSSSPHTGYQVQINGNRSPFSQSAQYT